MPRMGVQVLCALVGSMAGAPLALGDASPFIRHLVMQNSTDGGRHARPVDLDGDGDVDILAAMRLTDSVVWFESDGASPPAFTRRTVAAGVESAWDAVAADFDGDGDLDVLASALGSGGNQGLFVYVENLGGSPAVFAAPLTVASNLAAPTQVEAADIDGDGDIDAAAGLGDEDQFEDDAVWLENDGAGGFTAHTLIAAADFIHTQLLNDVQLADIDLDGDIDIYVSSTYARDVIFFNDGGSPPSWTADDGPFGASAAGGNQVHLADINGDGDFGALNSGFSDQQVFVLSEHVGTVPTGLLWEQRELTVETSGTAWPIASCTADFDMDGDIDIASMWGNATDRLHLFESDLTTLPSPDETPSFTDRAYNIPMAGPSFGSIHAADFDGDGDADLLMSGDSPGNLRTIAWVENAAPPVLNLRTGVHWQTVTEGLPLAAADDVLLAREGYFDASESMVDLRGSGVAVRSRGFLRQPAGVEYVLGDGTAFEAPFSDMVINGRVEVAPGATAALSSEVLEARGTSELDVGAGGALSLGSHEVSVSGVATVRAGGALLGGLDLSFSGGFPGWTEGDSAEGHDDVRALAAGDLDGDGDVDLVAGLSGGAGVAWLENDGGVFTSEFVTVQSPGVRAVHTADIDLDGDLDIVSCSAGGGHVDWVENDGAADPTFTRRLITTSAEGAVDCVVSDMNGDGRPDILVAAQTDGEVLLFVNSEGAGGSPEFAEVVLSSGITPRAVAAADVDGDGDLDALSAGFLDDVIGWHENLGDGTWGPRVAIDSSHSRPEALAVGDFDNDGDADVAAVFTLSGTLVVYKNDGMSPPSFTPEVASSSLDEARSVRPVDADRDGDLDLLVADAGTGEVTLFRNHNGSFFSLQTVEASGGGESDAIGFDVDGDGDPDVATAAANDGEVLVHVNGLGRLRVGAGAAVSATGGMYCGLPMRVDGGALAAANTVRVRAETEFYGGTVDAATLDLVQGGFVGYGDLYADVENATNMRLLADTTVVGSLTNDGDILVQDGALTVIGPVVNNGEIVGALEGSTVLFAEGGLTVGAAGSLRMPSAGASLRVGGPFDAAVQDAGRFDLAAGELRVTGPTGGEVAVEVMSADLGAVEEGFEASNLAMGSLRIGPGASTASLVDARDNATGDAGAAEAVYVDALVIDPGATMRTNGLKVYYRTLSLGGTVDEPANLVEFAGCVQDISGDGAVDGIDLAFVLGDWGPCDGCAADLNNDGLVNGIDLGFLLGAWGACE